jgi:uncharacterized protein with PIN domain
MLGRLARWLRMLGVDTAYIRDVEDSRLVRIARGESRTILTRDRRLATDFPGCGCIVLTANDTTGQLQELVSVLGSLNEALEAGKSRCAICNGEIDAVDKKSALNKVPEYVYLSTHDFWECTDCGKVYWEGSHRKNFLLKIRELLSGETGC